MGFHSVDRTGAGLRSLDRAGLEQQLRQGFFWLDVQRPSEQELKLLGDVLDLHPLALEDSLHFDQRPKLEPYDTFTFVVLYGHVPDEDLLVEVQCYVSDGFLVTVRSDEAPALEELRRSYETRPPERDAVSMLYRIADFLSDSFFPALTTFDDQLDRIEDALVSGPQQEHLREVLRLRRRLSGLRRVVGPQRDIVGRIASGAAVLPGITPEHERYFRDVSDHLLRVSELIESARDLIASEIDVYLSASSQRMNSVMKQLTLIASIFLPLSFVTGFFGQNFSWMVDHVGSFGAFLVLGIGSQLVGIALLTILFKRSGWF